MDSERRESRKPRRSSKKRLWLSVPRRKPWKKKGNKRPLRSRHHLRRSEEKTDIATSAATKPGTSVQNAAKNLYCLPPLTPQERLPASPEETGVDDSEESSPNHQVLVFCPKCDEAVPHTVQGVQQDQTKILVAKVYHYFEQEYEQLKKLYGSIDLTPLSKFRQRTALATGVSESNVLRILKEEEERAARVKEVPQERGRKRARQASSDGENDSDDDDDPGEPANSAQTPEEGVETYVVKVEPPDYHPDSEVYTDPLQQVKEEPKDSEYVEVEAAVASVMVKPEPPEDIPETTKTTAVTKAVEPIVRKGRKKQRKSEVTSTQQHTQGEPSTAQASGSVPAGELDESGMLEDGTVIVEKFEIHEEGFS